MTSQLFWHSVTGTWFWGVCWEGFSLPHPSSTLMGPHLTCWGSRAVRCSSVSCKVPRSSLGSKGSTMVQKYCHSRWQLVWEEVWLTHHGICLCNAFLKPFFWTLSISWRRCILCLQHRFLSLLSPASCPSIRWSSHTSTVSAAHFQIFCLFSHFGYELLPKACPRPSVVIQVWLYHQSWQILP